MSEWQPIETAPRDGTEVLVIENHPKFNDGIYAVVVFVNTDWVEMNGGNIKNFTFSHWMPLPAPPKATP